MAMIRSGIRTGRMVLEGCGCDGDDDDDDAAADDFVDDHDDNEEEDKEGRR